jgi:hypothetical protein
VAIPIRSKGSTDYGTANAIGGAKEAVVRSVRAWALGVGAPALCLFCASFWFVQQACLRHDAWVRLGVAGAFLFLVPGCLLGELLRLRSRHPLETVAKSFALSLAVELALLPIPFFLQARLDLWLVLLLLTALFMTGGLALRLLKEPRLYFVCPLLEPSSCDWARHARSILLLGIPLVLTVGAYRAGEDLTDIGGEKLLHLMFVRYYYAMPLQLSSLGVEFNMPPPNLVNLWEFLVAAWARLAGLDPLLVFGRARLAIPLLGLSAMYWLVRMVFPAREKSALVFLGVALLALGQFVLDGPTLSWVRTADATRGIFAFGGTVHHADGAMDIMLPLGGAALLQFLRRPAPLNAVLFASTLFASFLWHPREFLQLALYQGAFGAAALVIPSLRRRLVGRRWILATGILAATALTCLALSSALVPRQSHAYNEAGLKKQAVAYALMPENILGVRHFFNFPYHFLPAHESLESFRPWPEMRASLYAGWHVDPWIICAAVAALILGLFGRADDCRLSGYFLLLWFVALCWNFSLLLIFALTYSEFYMTTPRLLYLLSYLVMADGLVFVIRGGWERCARVMSWFTFSRGRLPLTCFVLVSLASFAAGYGFETAVRTAAAYRPLCICLSLFMFLTLLKIICFRSLDAPSGYISPGAVFVPVLLFFVPYLATHLRHDYRVGRFARRAPLAWYEASNPFGLSPKFIVWIQGLPPQRIFLVHPDKTACLYAYAPHYLAIFTGARLFKDFATLAQVREGRHPLFPIAAAAGKEAHSAAVGWLGDHRVDYIFLNKDDYDSPRRAYFLSHPTEYSIAFDNSTAREIVFRYSRCAPVED